MKSKISKLNIFAPETITIYKDYLDRLFLLIKNYKEEKDERRKLIWLNQLLSCLEIMKNTIHKR